MQSDAPIVLLIDVASEVSGHIQTLGCRILEASLGTPYLTEVDGKIRPLKLSHSFPENFHEADIVIVDTTSPNAAASDNNYRDQSNKVIPWYRANERTINPRGFSAMLFRNRFDEMHRRGTSFIVIAGKESVQSLCICSRDQLNDSYNYKTFQAFSSFEFLTSLSNLRLRNESGTYIALSEAAVKSGIPGEGSFYEVVVDQTPQNSTVIATNKDGRTTSFVDVAQNPLDKDRKGFLFFCHKFDDPTVIPQWVVGRILPNLSPYLFPQTASEQWIQSAPYEDPEIAEKRIQIDQILAAAEEKVSALRLEIEAIRETTTDKRSLLTSSGDELVESVKTAFIELGLASVKDMDADKAEEERRKEDIRIVDGEFTAVCEVKGLTGLPREEDLSAVMKYVNMAMRELESPYVKGLTVVNHQRLTPPLSRTNDRIFDPQFTDFLIEQHIGVISTWDLFKLLRSTKRCGWSIEEIKGIFSQTGRIRPIPVQFVNAGTVEHVWKKINAFGLLLSGKSIAVGSRYLISCEDGVREGVISSLKVGNKDVPAALSGTEVGVVGTIDIQDVKEKSTLYLTEAI